MSAAAQSQRVGKPRGRLALASQLLLLQLAVIVATVVVGSLISLWLVRAQLDQQYAEKCLAIAGAVAADPTIRNAFSDADPARTIEPIAEAVRRSSGASFVVVANREGVRYSHPNPSQIGKHVSTDPSPALAGRPWVGVQTGTLGRSVRGKVPIFDVGGNVIGMVSVGFLEQQVSARLLSGLPAITVTVALALGLGVTGSLILARRLKRQTFGLEPNEIAALLEQREAMLHGIREGTLATDREDRITLVNDEGRRLLGLDESCMGRRPAEVLPPGRLRDVVAGRLRGPDQVVLAGERVLVANWMPVQIRGQRIGSVITLRDRTELDGLLRELHNIRGLSDALRAQAHEFSNKLHTVAGLIELGHHQDALRFVTETSLVHQELIEFVSARVRTPVLAALLLAKAAVASERGIQFGLTDDTLLTEDLGDAHDLATVAGNLIDNAVEAVGGGPGGRIKVGVRADPAAVRITVRDSGPGVDPRLVEEIFRDGFTTKASGSTSRRGLGLALVRQLVLRRGGEVQVRNDHGAVFTARIPHAVRAGPEHLAEALTR